MFGITYNAVAVNVKIIAMPAIRLHSSIELSDRGGDLLYFLLGAIIFLCNFRLYLCFQ